MANTPYHSSGFVISYPPVSASVSIDITSFYSQSAVSPFSSSLLNVNGINIRLYRGGTPLPPNTPDIVNISTVPPLSNTLPVITLAFNTSSSIAPYNSFWSNITASDDGASILNLTAKNNILETQNYYYISGSTTVPFSDPVFNKISGSFAGFTVVSDPVSIVPVIKILKDYSGNVVLTNYSLTKTKVTKTYDQYISSIEITSGSLLLYSLSTTIPQI
jgi:hypothetical protein